VGPIRTDGELVFLGTAHAHLVYRDLPAWPSALILGSLDWTSSQRVGYNQR
jgi:hypothetical protein